MSRAGKRRGTIGVLALALFGCQLVLPSAETQCKSDGDCDARGGEFASTVCVEQVCVAPGDRCIGTVKESVEDRLTTIHTRMRVVNIGGTPLAKVPILVCAVLDENCESPVGAPVLTDAAGYAYVTIWKNFRGSLQVKNPPAGADYLKLKIHFLGAIETDDKPDREIPPDGAVRLLTRTIFNLQLGTTAMLDPNAGHIVAQASDCDQKPRAGVRVSSKFESEAGAPLSFYFTEDQLISGTATETASRGLFGIVNAPEGPVTLEADVASTGKALGRVRIWVNKDTISNLSLGPTALP